MGCDIHLYTERYSNSARKWYNSDMWHYDPWEDRFVVQSAYEGRDYDLFALLAGVRNGCGVTPISEPRGLPLDVSKPVADAAKRHKDNFAHSWLTLEELNEYRGLPEIDRFLISLWDSNTFPDNAKNFRIVFWFDQ